MPKNTSTVPVRTRQAVASLEEANGTGMTNATAWQPLQRRSVSAARNWCIRVGGLLFYTRESFAELHFAAAVVKLIIDELMANILRPKRLHRNP